MNSNSKPFQGSSGPPVFFRGSKDPVKKQQMEQEQENAAAAQSSTPANTNAPAFRPTTSSTPSTQNVNKNAAPFVKSNDSAPADRRQISDDDLKDEGFGRMLNDNQAKAVEYQVTDEQFSSFPEIPARTVSGLQGRGIKELFPIQMHSFYPIYNREDIIARDLTGSGKTLAFSLPVIECLRKNKQLGSRKIQAICLAPTRELAIQVSNEIQKLRHFQNEFNVLTVYGGVSIDDQTRQLRNGVDIFVGTTGRVLDHIERGNIDFRDLKTVVLDEADQMLKLGFKEDVDNILRKVKSQVKEIQICLFSATIPRWVHDVSREHLRKGFKIIDLVQNLKKKTAINVNHLAINCPYHNRISALADILVCYGTEGKTIVFAQTKNDANSLILSDKIKMDIEVMHGDIAQNQREVTMKRFKEGKFKVLVATDVASRGLDINQVELIIQLEPPMETETYIHRSGRTARAGRTGTCITFYTKKTQGQIQTIEQQAGIKFKKIGVPQPEDVIKASSKGILTNLQDVNPSVLPLFADAAKELLKQEDGNSEAALCKALAYISGYYKQDLISRSLLTGQERQTTIIMTSRNENSRLDMRGANMFLGRWPPKIADSVRNMRQIRDGSGVCFDIYSDHYDRFIDNYDHLADREANLEFHVEKCTELPDCIEEGEFSSNWRDNNDDYGGFGGMRRQQSYQPNYGGGGNYRGGRGRGGYDRRDDGYGNSSRGRGGGGWDRQGGSYYDRDNGNYDQQPHFQKSNSYSGGGGGYGRGTRGGFQGGNNNNYYGDRDNRSGYSNNYQQQQQSHEQQKPITSVFVSGLGSQFNDQKLKEAFQNQKLNVVRARVLYGQDGESKGSGFVELSSHDEAQQAVNKVNGQVIEGRKLMVQFSKN